MNGRIRTITQTIDLGVLGEKGFEVGYIHNRDGSADVMYVDYAGKLHQVYMEGGPFRSWLEDFFQGDSDFQFAVSKVQADEDALRLASKYPEE